MFLLLFLSLFSLLFLFCFCLLVCLEANRAVRVLRERRFAKRKVECELYDMPSYNKHKYDL